MKTIFISAVLILISATMNAKSIDIPGMYISTSTTTSPGGFETKVQITCALVSTDRCYTATVPDKSTIDPREVDGDLEPVDQYTQIKVTNGDIYSGKVISHYQHNVLGESGQINRVHTLTIVP